MSQSLSVRDARQWPEPAISDRRAIFGTLAIACGHHSARDVDWVFVFRGGKDGENQLASRPASQA